MLVVEPSTLRYEEEAIANAQHEGQLVERVSMLENRLLRFAERLERSLELLLNQARVGLSDHTLLETLIGLLAETGKIDREKLDHLWRAALPADEIIDRKQSNDAELLRASIVAEYHGEDEQAFAALVSEGLELQAQGKIERARRALERASALAPDNVGLNFILGVQFFNEGKFPLAQVYLQRAYNVQPASAQIYLMLAIASGDAGEVEQARKLMSEMMRQRGSSFAVHYTLGRFDAIEENWKAALAQFRGALAAKPCAEAHYLMSFALAQLGRFRTALRHVNKAIELDENYGGAFQLLGYIQDQLGEAASAQAALATAHALGLGASAGRAGKKRPSGVSAELLLHSFFGAARHGRKRLLMGGDERLAKLLHEDALAQVGFRTLTVAR